MTGIEILHINTEIILNMPKPKQKKSKSQLEAERKAQEEEEERLRLEKEEEKRKRKEEIRQLQELARKNKINRWTKDWHTSTNLKSDRYNRKVYEEKLINDQSDWETYLKCEDVIDICNAKEVHSFLSEAQSDPCSFELGHFNNLCHQINQIVVDFRVATLLSNKNLYENDQYGFSIKGLYKLVMKLLDDATELFLQKYEGTYKTNTNTRTDEVNGTKFLGKSSDVAFSFGSSPSVSLTNVDITVKKMEIQESCLRLVRLPFVDYESCGTQLGAIGDVYQFDILTRSGGRFSSEELMFECRMKIPNNLLTSEFKVMVFSEGSWKDDNISNVVLTEDAAVQFVVCDTKQNSVVFALVQSSVLDIPYKSWKLGPTTDKRREGKNVVVQLSLQTARHKLTFQCFMSTCCLVQPNLPEFKNILGVELLPSTLLLQLSNMGVHLLPTDDEKFDNKELGKAQIIEESFYDELSLLSASFQIESSKHNKTIGRERSLCQIKESSVFTASHNPLPENLLLAEVQRKSSVAQSQEELESLPPQSELVSWSILEDSKEGDFDLLSFQSKENRDVDEDSSHLYPLFCVEKLSSKQAFDRVVESSPTTTETIKQLLRLVRPLVCCE